MFSSPTLLIIYSATFYSPMIKSSKTDKNFHILKTSILLFRDPPTNFVPVHNHNTGIKRYASSSSESSGVDPNSIGVCVKPLHFSYNKTMELLQFIELNRILGVSRYCLFLMPLMIVLSFKL